VSDSERPDIPALAELSQLIHALGEEMAAWRRRAHEAEARVKDADARLREAEERLADATAAASAAAEPGGSDESATLPPETSAEMEALRRENETLRQRVEGARVRTGQLLDKLRFLRQQHELEAER
jgi:hypothetical protein